MFINNYQLIGELNNANSGFSKWGFAVRNHREYFIKELLQPVYPMDPSVMPEDMFYAKRARCDEYEQRSVQLYSRINAASTGNLVRILEFFRSDSKYYLITEKVEGPILNVQQIAMLPVQDKYMSMISAAYAFMCLHNAGVVHFDVKPANILIKRTKYGRFTAKLIDFDSGFILGESREDFELGGDLTYLAPETFLAIAGEESELDEKVDIFALGLVFHEFFAGTLPTFDTEEYEYPYEAALDKGVLMPDYSRVPRGVGELIQRMLDVDSEKRPSALEVVNALAALSGARPDLDSQQQNAPNYMTTHHIPQPQQPPQTMANGSRLRTTFRTSASTTRLDTTPVSEPVPVPTATPTEVHVEAEKPAAEAGKWFSSAGDL